MVVTLIDAAKNWLAINAGVNNCFSPTEVVYQLPDETTPRTGSTGDVVNAFWAVHAAGLDTAQIVAEMDYIGFKIINGGVDLTMGSNIPGLIDGDVKFAYANDGTTSGIPAYCAPPAHTISTGLTTNVSICAAPCTTPPISVTVSWINDGALPDLTFTPGVTVDGGLPTTMAPYSLAAGVPVSHTFTISELAIGSHSICASPGTHCRSVDTVTTIDICNWIISRGGWTALKVYDIMQLVAAYLVQISLGFTVTTLYIMGAVAYYLGPLPNNGNSLTGCTFG